MKNLTKQTLRFSLSFVACIGLFIGLLAGPAAYAQITPSQDSYTNTADPTTNYGANVLLFVEGPNATSYIQFNLASIPAGVGVSQATLKLYVNAVSKAGSLNVDYVNGSWVENTITSSLAPALGTTIASSVPITAADKNQYILINVTTAVEAWLNGSQANDGLALVGNGTFSANFDSKENTTTSHPPELDIVFAGGGTITGVTTSSGSGLTGGGTSGTLNLGLLSTCSSGQVLQWSGSAWVCTTPKGTGTITGVTAGTDLTGGGTRGSVTLNLDTTKVPLLGANNTFIGNQSITGNLTATGAISAQTETLNVSSTTTALTINATGGGGGISVGASNSPIGISVLAASTAIVAISNDAGAYAVIGSGPTIGVYGNSTGTASDSYGVLGISSNVGVHGVGSGSAGIGLDGHGTGIGAKGVGTATTGSSIGVYGQTASTSGYGVQGASPNIGVYGASNGASVTGATIGTKAGIWGDTGGSDDSSSAVLGTADGNVAGYFINNAPINTGTAWPSIIAENLGTGSNGSLVLLAQGNDGQCTIDGSGDLTCSGKVTAVVSADNGARKISLHAVQSAENWFEDAGSGQLSNGSARIALDSTFAQTVNTSVEYHVFLTPNGDCKGLYVSQKSATSFEVRELGGGTSSIAFDYRIMAKRAGYEKDRLEDVTQRYQQMAQQQRLREEHVEQRRRK